KTTLTVYQLGTALSTVFFQTPAQQLGAAAFLTTLTILPTRRRRVNYFLKKKRVNHRNDCQKASANAKKTAASLRLSALILL
ncbi:hypothetical protein, partial [Lacticaseibacillus camelliae]|uniref:hypothetical protein n=1 Tax=Lacticaseibacillus camelliae TaxID=381742 RepID=UPI001CDA84F1